MLSPGDRVVVAVSGGPDSICLLHLLHQLAPEFELELFVAHLNHMLREEAIQEEKFVRQIAEDLSLPFYSERIDVKSLLQKGESLEEGARRLRYDFLKRASERFSASKVALGHNADDLVETVLFNLIRGTGLGGMRGIPPIRKEKTLTYIRPLIGIWREEIEKYLEEKNIPYVIDKSNLSLQFTRNKIRHRIIPLLQEINPKVKAAIYRLAVISGEVHSFLRKEAGEKKRDIVELKTRYLLKINLSSLLSSHPALQKEMLRIVLAEFGGDMSEMGNEAIESVLEMKEKETLTLPGNLRARREGMFLLFNKGKRRTIPYQMPLKVPGYTFIPPAGMGIEAQIIEGHYLLKDPSCLEVTLDADEIRGELIARSWKRGDRMIPLGMNQAKKLQDMFVDCKVPREKRHRIPLICDEEGILWVVGLRIAERAKVKENTKRTLHLRAIPEIFDEFA